MAVTSADRRRTRGARARLTASAAFVREFVRNPGATGAIAPSSRRLAARMVEGLDFARVRTIVEFGPGSGVFTRAVVERLPKGWLRGRRQEGGERVHDGAGRFIAIEFNPQMAAIVRREFPQVEVEEGSAEHVERLCAGHGIGAGEVDLIISGLAWASFPPDLTTRILEATRRALRPGGEFRTFAYHVGLWMPGARHFRNEAERLFESVSTSRGVWANLPPAFVYRCIKRA